MSVGRGGSVVRVQLRYQPSKYYTVGAIPQVIITLLQNGSLEKGRRYHPVLRTSRARLNADDATTPSFGHPSSPEEGSYNYLAAELADNSGHRPTLLVMIVA